jgi:hypothetical protein
MAFVFIGVGILIDDAPPETGNFLLHTLLPPPIRAALWLLPGIAALCAATHRGTGKDGYGFAALVVPVIIRCVSYLCSAIGYVFGLTPWPYAWTYALTWSGLLAIILIIAGWPEVPELAKKKRRPRRTSREDAEHELL